MEDLQKRHREMAFKVWKETGQNLVKTVAALSRDHGYDISRQSLAKWRDDFNWERRIIAEEQEELDREDALSAESIVNSLIKRRKQYEDYFNTLSIGKIDNQAQYGLNSVLKTLYEIGKDIGLTTKEPDIDRPKLFMEDMAFIAETLQEIDPEGLKILSRNFDGIVQKFKESHA